MSKFKNESGAALVMTLMIITLLLLFILTLFYQITNTTKQIATMEKRIVAEQIAEMGVDYYRSYIESVLPESISDSSEIMLPDISLREPVHLKDKISYWIEDHRLEKIDEQQMTITFTSVGEAYGETNTIESSITINIESGD